LIRNSFTPALSSSCSRVLEPHRGHTRKRQKRNAPAEFAAPELKRLKLNAFRPISEAMTRIALIVNRLLDAQVTSREEGQALIEYALIISLIALVALAALKATGTNVTGILNKIAGEV
jgi:Flp pilus assembly pilin Flp